MDVAMSIPEQQRSIVGYVSHLAQESPRRSGPTALNGRFHRLRIPGEMRWYDGCALGRVATRNRIGD
jgi:hypothetical protein